MSMTKNSQEVKIGNEQRLCEYCNKITWQLIVNLSVNVYMICVECGEANFQKKGTI